MMRKQVHLLGALGAVVFTGFPALAADIEAQSRVSAATIYPMGATVTRTAPIETEAGAHRIIIDDLPLGFDAASLRVTGEGDAAFEILGVDHAIERAADNAPASPERTRLEAEIDALQSEIDMLEREKGPFLDQLRAAKARHEFIKELMQHKPQELKDEMARNDINPQSWRGAIQVIGEEMQTTVRLMREAENALEDIDQRGADQREALEKLTRHLENLPPAPPRSVLSVNIDAKAALSGELRVSYRINRAHWSPLYDLRLMQQDGAAMGDLRIERRARIRQSTGEDWEDVALTLSTARPSQRMAAPTPYARQAALAPQIDRRQRESAKGALSLYGSMPAPEPVPVPEEAEADYAGNVLMSQSMAMDERYAGVPKLETFIAAAPTEMIAQLQGQTVIYQIPQRADVSGEGEDKQLFIGAVEIETPLMARATPALDKTAYLYAALANETGGPVLAGEASLFRDGAFIGQTDIPFIAAGDEKALPFGAIDGLIVTHKEIEISEGEAGGVAPHQERIEHYEMSARSTLDFDIPFTFFDHAPYSQTDQVEVTIKADPAPSERDVKGVKGVLAWTFELPAAEERSVSARYHVEWPLDRALMLRGR